MVPKNVNIMYCTVTLIIITIKFYEEEFKLICLIKVMNLLFTVWNLNETWILNMLNGWNFAIENNNFKGPGLSLGNCPPSWENIQK